MAPIDLAGLTKSEIVKFIDQFDVICTDCDGVLWVESQVFPHTSDFINAIVESGKRIYFITNNSTVSRESLLAKCQKFGFNVSLDSMTTPPYSIAQYLKKIGFTKKAYVTGFEQIGRELEAVGIEHIGIGPDVFDTTLGEYFQEKYRLDSDVGVVISGVDPHFSFPKLLKAVNYLKNPEVLFLSTNSDDRLDFPTFYFPDAGSFVKSIEAGSRRKATVIGKTSTFVCDLIAENAQPVNNAKTLMIGDRIDVDMVFGRNCGMKTLLVETGMSSRRDVDEVMEKIEKGNEEEVKVKKMIPDYVISGLEELFKKWKEEF